MSHLNHLNHLNHINHINTFHFRLSSIRIPFRFESKNYNFNIQFSTSKKKFSSNHVVFIYYNESKNRKKDMNESIESRDGIKNWDSVSIRHDTPPINVFPFLNHAQKNILALELGMNTKKLQYLLRSTRKIQRREHYHFKSSLKELNELNGLKEFKEFIDEKVLNHVNSITNNNEIIKDILINNSLEEDKIHKFSKVKLTKEKRNWIVEYIQEHHLIEALHKLTESLFTQISNEHSTRYCDALKHEDEKNFKLVLDRNDKIVSNFYDNTDMNTNNINITKTNHNNTYQNESVQSHSVDVWDEIKSAHGLSIFIRKIQSYLKQKVFNKHHIQNIQEATGLNKFQIHHFLESYLSKPISNHQKQLFIEWINTSSGSNASLEEKLWIQQKLHLTSKQLRNMISYYESTKEKTIHGYSFIRNFLKDYKSENLLSFDKIKLDDDLIHYLSKSTSLSKFQVRKLIHYMNIKDGKITFESKKIINQWLEDKMLSLSTLEKTNLLTSSSILVSKILNKEDISTLINETNLSSRQIRGIVRRKLDELKNFRNNKKNLNELNDDSLDNIDNINHTIHKKMFRLNLSSNIRSELIHYIKLKNFKLNSEEKSFLQEKYKISRNQLNLFIWRLKHTNQYKILPENETIVQEYLNNLNNKKPSKNDINNLIHLTKLNRQQIHYLVNRKLINQMQTITDEKRFKLFSILEHQSLETSKFEILKLSETLNLHPEQIRSIIRHQMKAYLPYISQYNESISKILLESSLKNNFSNNQIKILENNQDYNQVNDIENNQENYQGNNQENKVQRMGNILSACKLKYPELQKRKLEFFIKYAMYKHSIQ